MVAFEVENIKNFMSLLLKGTTFDNFEVRLVSLKTFTNFEIDPYLNKEFFSLDEQENLNRTYCLWSELKPIVFELIKGSKLPKFIKLIISYPENRLSEIHENASSLFINIIFENNTLTCISGCSQKNFSMDKSVDILWDDYVKKFFTANKIILSEK